MPRKPITPPLTPVRSHAGVPSVGDILILSQATWRTGRAFSSGRRCAEVAVPAEFVDVEAELNLLAKALKQLADLLVNEQIASFIRSADRAAQDGVGIIFWSCGRTMDDVESITSKYQMNRKSKTAGGFTLERLWNHSLLEEYETFVWTADGGTVHGVHELLRMHTVTVSMLNSIFESFSVVGLENGIAAVAEKIQQIYQCHPDDLSAHVAEIRGFANAIGYDLPSPTLTMPPTPSIVLTPNRWSSSSINTLRQPSPNTGGQPLSRSSTLPSASQIADLLNKKLAMRPRSITLPTFEIGNASSAAENSFPQSLPVSPTSEDPPILHHIPESLDDLTAIRTDSVSTIVASPRTQFRSSLHRRSTSGSDSLRILPSGLFGTRSQHQEPVKTPSSSFFPQVTEKEKVPAFKRPERTLSQQQHFERTQFRNAVILCDVHGSQVDYTVASRSVASHVTGGIELEKAMHSCRICLVREKRIYQGGKVIFTLAIWAFSDDTATRMEQRLDETEEIIPVTSYFQPNIVSITIPTELVYHNIVAGAQPIKTVKTTLVNYHFDTPEGSREFQNQIFGRSLVSSFKITKVLRLHDGLVGRMAHHEQMCATENLRVWYEEESGGYLALIHFSVAFRQGYMKFYLNDVNSPIMIKDEGHKSLRVKGLRIPPVAGLKEKFTHTKKDIHAAKIEFTTDVDKTDFVALIREAQQRMAEVEQ